MIPVAVCLIGFAGVTAAGCMAVCAWQDYRIERDCRPRAVREYPRLRA